MNKFIGMALSVGAALLGCSSASAAEGPLVLAPSSEWRIASDSESCSISRQFGGTDEGVTFTLESFAPPSLAYNVVLRGKPLPHRDSGIIEFETRFNPDDSATEQVGILSRSEAPWLTFRASLEAASVVEARGRGEVIPPTVDSAREAAVNEFVIAFSRGRPLSLQLGSMTQPLAMLRECTGGLVEKWGLDPAVQQSLSQKPEPIDQSKWLGPGSYPWNYLRAYRSAMVNVRMMVDASGAVTQCVVQFPRTVTNAGLIACRELMKAAKFEPALDQSGNRVAGYVSMTIIFNTRRRNGNW